MHDVELDYAPGRLISWPGADIHYLMTPTEFAVGVHDRLVAEGQSLGLRHAGSLAAEVLAIGQQLRRFGSEANPMISVVAAGLDGGLDLEANRRFIGRASVVHERRRPPVRQIRAFTLRCDAPVALLNAPVMWNGQPAGYVTSGAIRLPQGKATLLALVELKDDDMQYVVVIDGQLLTLHPSTALGDAKALVAGV
jgi:4-methylaminobutanoate oxidase (formaldehyde-forming)